MKDGTTLLKALHKESSRDSPDLDSCQDILDKLMEDATTIDIQAHKKMLQSCIKSFRNLKRKTSEKQSYSDLIQRIEKLKKRESDKPEGDGAQASDEEPDDGAVLPKSVNVYKKRLIDHKKELYKDPPVLPPDAIKVYDERADLPKRDRNTLRLTFQALKGASKEEKTAIRGFLPNQTPQEVISGGAFGGTYFRSIHSAVTNESYKASDVLSHTVHKDWIKGLDKKKYLTSSTYDKSINKFGVSCGGSLGMWESSGWISNVDPYGWFQWYCRFYQGRRTTDDVRQISRWKKLAGPKGRFKSRLCNMILNAGRNDNSISPVIRQTLFHWGMLITDEVLEEHKNR